VAVAAVSCAPVERDAPAVVSEHQGVRRGSLKDTPVVQHPSVSDRQPLIAPKAQEKRPPSSHKRRPRTALMKPPDADQAGDDRRSPKCVFERVKSAYLKRVRLQTVCACEIFRARDESRCGGRSAEHRSGGNDPMCPTAEVFRTGILTQIFASGCERHLEAIQRETNAYLARAVSLEDASAE